MTKSTRVLGLAKTIDARTIWLEPLTPGSTALRTFSGEMLPYSAVWVMVLSTALRHGEAGTGGEGILIAIIQ